MSESYTLSGVCGSLGYESVATYGRTPSSGCYFYEFRTEQQYSAVIGVIGHIKSKSF